MMRQGADASILVLAPILLLLGQDRLLCRGLSVRRRYLPPAAVCVAFLFLKVRQWRLTCRVCGVPSECGLTDVAFTGASSSLHMPHARCVICVTLPPGRYHSRGFTSVLLQTRIKAKYACGQALAALWHIAWHGPDEVEPGDLEAPPSRVYLARNAALLALALPNLGHMLRVGPASLT